VERGYPLRALVRPSSQVDFLRDLGIELALGDVRDFQSVLDAAQGCHKVIHAAGKFRFWGRQQEFFAINVQGTANVLEAAARTRAERFVYISTIAVAGAPDSSQILDEDMPCDPQDAYQDSKLDAEKLALLYYADFGLPVVVLRPGAFYGPWGRYAFNRLFFEDPLKGLPLGVHHGKRVTFPIFVPDLVRAIEAALNRGRPGEIYHISGDSITHAEVHRAVSQTAGIRPWRINPPGWALILLAHLWTFLSRYTGREPYYPINLAPYVFCDWQASNQKAKQALGFQATPFQEGARQTVAWYREQGVGPKNWITRLIACLWRWAVEPGPETSTTDL
jgi:dihydroflavonol-4-reductase